MIRLDSAAATFETPFWTPAGETLLQLSAVPVTVAVDVQVRIHADAPWATVDTLRIKDRPIARIAQVPFMRLSLRGNRTGAQVTVRDNT